MPYVRCAECGLTTYAVRSRAQATECPRCGSRLDESGGRGSPDDTLALARRMLGMDVALLTEVCDGREVARSCAGEWPGVGSLAGASVPFDETFCKQMLEGRIGNIVADVAHDARVVDLEMARALGVGAWIGVPVGAALSRMYILCCLSMEAQPALSDRDVYVLKGLADTLETQLAVAPD